MRRSPTVKADLDDEALANELFQLVKTEKSRHKWLVGGVEFTEDIPKSPSGKLLRRVLRDREREKRKANRAVL